MFDKSCERYFYKWNKNVSLNDIHIPSSHICDLIQYAVHDGFNNTQPPEGSNDFIHIFIKITCAIINACKKDSFI